MLMTVDQKILQVHDRGQTQTPGGYSVLEKWELSWQIPSGLLNTNQTEHS
jgi:hypothetical protein